MKKIALFSDGTGNSPANLQRTNVWRAYQALDRRPGSNQIAFYDNGVGTSRFTPVALLGLGFGWGLARNVREIYGFLCRTYDPGDRIYGFGFSRGAFTIRVVIAMIASEGIIDRNLAADDRDLDRLIRAAYRRFRGRNFTPSMLSSFLAPTRDFILNHWYRATGRRLYDHTRNLHSDPKKDKEKLIQFLGVWDTVDAYGLPIDELTRAWDKVVWPLTAKDRDLSTRVARACHALALDEQRASFKPMLWNEKNRALGASIDHDRIAQVWFAGVHSNVGGGYPDDSLAYVSLNWMLEQSEKNDGLTFLPEERRYYLDQADPMGPKNDSRNGVGMSYRYGPRALERLCHERKPGLANWLKDKFRMAGAELNEVDIVKPKIHHTVFERIARSGSYAPINLPADYAVVEADGTVVDVAAAGPDAGPLRESASDAVARRGRQSHAWNKVWAHQLLYVVTLAVVAVFVVYPYRPFVEDGALNSYAASIFGTVGFIIQSIPGLIGKIPGLEFAQTWADQYGQHPYVFAFGAILIGVLLIVSLKVNAALNSEMRNNWHHLTLTGNAPPPAVHAFRRKLAAFLEGPIYTDWIARPRRIALEALAIALLLALLFAAFSRTVFTAIDGFGGICTSSDTVSRAYGDWFRFDPKEPCADTGLPPLTRGHGYAIDLYLPGDWRDAGIAADLTGWRDASWFYYVFTPWRRHLLTGWYQPVARIGSTLFDRYPIHPTVDKGAMAMGPRKDLRMEFEARRSGRLYLYVNDAVVFTPGFMERFYANNVGYACVRVVELGSSQDGTIPDDARPDGKADITC